MNNPHSVGTHAACEALFSGSIKEVAETLLQANQAGHTQLLSGGLLVMLESLAKLRKAGADLSVGRDEQAAEFLRKGHATMQLEMMNAAGDDLGWRVRAIADTLADYRAWFKRAEVIEHHRKSAPEATPVQVVSMPDRVTHQTVQRDSDGEIISTTQIQRDYA
jgi:hypothetical protein